MKKTISILCTIASLALICDAANLGHKLMMFLLAGIVPGTDIILSGDQMLILIFSLASIVFTAFVAIPIIHKLSLINAKQKHGPVRKLSRARA